MPTPEEVQNLKKSWYDDPCWDIETTDGFENHKEELRQYRMECEEKWDAIYQEKLQKMAHMIGIPDNLKMAKYLQILENRVVRIEELLNGERNIL